MKKFFRIGSSKKGKGPDSSSQGKGSTKSLDSKSTIGYEVKEKDLSKFHKAAWTGDISKVKQFAKKEGNPPDKEKRTPLHLACSRGHDKVVTELLEWIKKPDVFDIQQKTALMRAVENGKEECARLLLNSHANPNIQDQEGNTCLHLAAKRGDNDMIALFAAVQKIDPDIQNNEGYTPLHLTVLNKHLQCCDTLDHAEPELDIQDADGRTALMVACHGGQVEFVKKLLDFGADKHLKDKQGWTADEIASMAGNEACRKILREHISDDEDESTRADSSQVSPRRSKSNTQAAAAGGLGAPAENEEDDVSVDETSKMSEAAGGGANVVDSWRDSDESEDEEAALRTQFQKEKLLEEKKAKQAHTLKKKGLKTHGAPRGKSPGPAMHNIDESEADELQDVVDEYTTIDDVTTDPQKPSDVTDNTAQDHATKVQVHSSNVVMESDDVMVVEDFDIEDDNDEEPYVNDLTGGAQVPGKKGNNADMNGGNKAAGVSGTRSRESSGAWSEDDESLFSSAGPQKNKVNLVQAKQIHSNGIDKEEPGNENTTAKNNESKSHDSGDKPHDTVVLDDWSDEDESLFSSASKGAKTNVNNAVNLLQMKKQKEEEKKKAESEDDWDDNSLSQAAPPKGPSLLQAMANRNHSNKNDDTDEKPPQNNATKGAAQVLDLSDVSDVSEIDENEANPAAAAATPAETINQSNSKVPLSARSKQSSEWDSEEELDESTHEAAPVYGVTSQETRDEVTEIKTKESTHATPRQSSMNWDSSDDEDDGVEDIPTLGQEILAAQTQQSGGAVLRREVSLEEQRSEHDREEACIMGESDIISRLQQNAVRSSNRSISSGLVTPPSAFQSQECLLSQNLHDAQIPPPLTEVHDDQGSQIDYKERIKALNQQEQDNPVDPPLSSRSARSRVSFGTPRDLHSLQEEAEEEDLDLEEVEVKDTGLDNVKVTTVEDKKEDEEEDNSNWDSGSEVMSASPRKDNSQGFTPEIDSVLAANKEKTVASQAAVSFGSTEDVLTATQDKSEWDSDSELVNASRHDEIDSVLQANKPAAIAEEETPASPKQTPKQDTTMKSEDEDDWDSDPEDDAPDEAAVDTQAFLTEPPPLPATAAPTQRAPVTQGSMMAEDSESEEEEEESTWEKEAKAQKEKKKHEEDARKAEAAKQAMLAELSDEDDEEDEKEGEVSGHVDEDRRRQWESEWEANQEKLRREAAEEMRREIDMEKRQSMESLDQLDANSPDQSQAKPQPNEELESDDDIENQVKVGDKTQAQAPNTTSAVQRSSSTRDQPPQIESDFSDEDDETGNEAEELRMRQEHEAHKLAQQEKQRAAEAETKRQQEEEDRKADEEKRKQEEIKRNEEDKKRKEEEDRKAEKAKEEEARKREAEKREEQQSHQRQTDAKASQQKAAQQRAAVLMDVSFEDTDDDMEIMPSITTTTPRKNEALFNHKDVDDDDDDGLSYSSTEHEASVHEDRIMPQSHHVSHQQDLSVASMASESVNVMRLQEQFRDSQRKLDRERNSRSNLESKKTNLEQERTDLIQKLEDITRAKSALEQGKIELEAKIRNFQYQLTEESEKRKNSEVLYNKCREQLERKEAQFTTEIEAKQKSELAMRNLQIELRTALSKAKQAEEEREDLARQLNHERDARLLQEKINEEQQRFNQSLHEDSAAHNDLRMQLAEALAKLEAQGEGGEQGAVDRSTRTELVAVRAECERQRARHKEEHDLLSGEIEELHNKIKHLKDDLKLGEEALAHATMNYTVEVGTLKTENSKLQANISHERAELEKLKTENESMRTRLDGCIKELEKEQVARSDLERDGHKDKDEWRRLLDKSEHEQASLKQTNQTTESRLRETESKMSRLENELAVANATLVERTNQLTTIQRELEQRTAKQGGMDDTLMKEKDENTRLQVRCETQQERVTALQHEVVTLRQQLDEARVAGAKGEGAENLNQVLNSLRADQEKNQAALQEKNTALNESLLHLKEELRSVDNRRITAETELRTMQNEFHEAQRKLAVAEASLEVTNKGKVQMDTECSRLRNECEALKSRLSESTEKQLDATRHVTELTQRSERAETQAKQLSEQLAANNGNMSAMAGVKSDAEGKMHKLEMEKTRLESTLNHETHRVETLQRELADSQQACVRAQEEVGELRAENTGIKLNMNASAANQNLASYEADDAKQMYENEVKSRSKLGLKIAQLERSQQEQQALIDEEKRKVRKAMELKKTAETKLEEEQQKCAQLQKEITSLRGYLKAAKKRLKELDVPENEYNKLQDGFAEERRAMNYNLNELRQRASHTTGSTDVERLRQDLAAQTQAELNMKLQEVNAYLEDQAGQRDKLDRLREDHDSDMRREFERTKRELLDELARVRAEQQSMLSERDLHEREAKRLQNLYDSEVRMREKLMQRLEKANQNTHVIMSERQYTPHGYMHPPYPGGGPPPANLDGSYMLNNQWSVNKRSHGVNDLSAKIRQELDRSIAKHLEKGPHIDITPPARTTMDDTAMTMSSFNKSRSDYLHTLQRNYFV